MSVLLESLPWAFVAFMGVTVFSILSISANDQQTQYQRKSTSDLPALRKGSNSVVVIGRIHRASSQQMTDISKVIAFCNSCDLYANSVILCIDVGSSNENEAYINELAEELDRRSFSKVTIQRISPWGHFTLALNAGVQIAVDGKFDFIIFQSIEFSISHSTVQRLLRYMEPSTLVVGPVLPGHEYLPGENTLRGRTCPWNTFAIWNTRQLAMLGFPMIGDGFGEPFGGVEEVSTISLLQQLQPQLKAYLVRTDDVKWETTFTDVKRQEYHRVKMASKDERPAKQLSILGLSPGRVIHLDDGAVTP